MAKYNWGRNGSIFIFIVLSYLLCHSDAQSSITGGLISQTTGVACSNIYTDFGSDDPDSQGTLTCNKASVLMLSVPLIETPPGAYEFKFTESGPTGGGTLKGDPSQCAKGPGYCLFGRDFYVVVTVSPVATAYDLVAEDIVAPFGYLYENCISKAPSTGNTFYPYYSEATCGVADIWDDNDYITCGDPAAFPPTDPFGEPAPTQYSDCAFMCGWEKTKLLNSPEYNNNLDKFTKEYCQNPDTMHDVKRDYLGDVASPLGCASASSYNADINPALTNLMPNYPLPTGICSCPNSATNDINLNAPQPRLVSSVVPCKSCSGSGSCGTALPLPQPTDPSQCTANFTSNSNTVCDCLLPKIDGLPPQDAADTVCFNTQQSHRCLKCQPVVNAGQYNESCAYMDINANAYCNTYWLDICGSGAYGLSGQVWKSDNTLASLNLCNCGGVFVDRSYWVKPVCAPYRIQNPSVPQYKIDVTLLYGEAFGTLNGTAVPNGTMTVGSGFDPRFPPKSACDSDSTGNTDATLPWIDGTVDGFAVTEIVGTYTSNGGSTTNLQGSIVVCNNGEGNEYCGNVEGVSSVNTNGVPSPEIIVTDPMGVENPWCRYRGCSAGSMNTSVPLVPLPDFLFDNITDTDGCNLVKKNLQTWWYYLSQEEKNTFGLGCGQNGMTVNGVGDAAMARTMCAGPQGTCIPGIDRRLRGEAVQPPCSVAVDFLEYVKRLLDNPDEVYRERPQHVPNDWTASLPNYAVHRGKLFAYSDPQVIDGRMAATLRLSIAADFDGVVVAQSAGTLTPVSCFISTVTGTGVFTADATNLGTVPAGYNFYSDPDNTTPQINMTLQTQTLAAATVSRITLPVETKDGYSGDAINNQFISVVMATSLGNFVQAITDPIQCVPQYGNPVIPPILSANTTLTEALADTYFNAFVNNPTCGFWCHGLTPFQRTSFFTPFEWFIMDFVINLLLIMLIAFIVVVVYQRIRRVEAMNIAEEQQVEREDKLVSRIAARNKETLLTMNLSK